MFSSFSLVPAQNIRFQSFSSQRLFVSCFQMAFLCTLICTEKCLPMELCSSRMQSKIWLKAFTNALQRTDRAFNRQTQLNLKSQVRTKIVFCFFTSREAAGHILVQVKEKSLMGYLWVFDQQPLCVVVSNIFKRFLPITINFK